MGGGRGYKRQKEQERRRNQDQLGRGISSWKTLIGGNHTCYKSLCRKHWMAQWPRAFPCWTKHTTAPTSTKNHDPCFSRQTHGKRTKPISTGAEARREKVILRCVYYCTAWWPKSYSESHTFDPEVHPTYSKVFFFLHCSCWNLLQDMWEYAAPHIYNDYNLNWCMFWLIAPMEAPCKPDPISPKIRVLEVWCGQALCKS